MRKIRSGDPGAYVDDRVRRIHFCLVNVLFRTARPRSGGLRPGVGRWKLPAIAYVAAVRHLESLVTDNRNFFRCK